MTRLSLAFSLLFVSAPLLHGQTAVPMEVAAVEPALRAELGVKLIPAAALTAANPLASVTASLPDTSSSSLPDSPGAVVSTSDELASAEAQAPVTGPRPAVAPRFNFIIQPNEQAVPLHGMEKAVYGLHDAFNPLQLVGITLSAGWSHLIDSQPHYGHNSEAFGKRIGAAALRSTVQTMATDAVFSPMFHDDPRYYVLGDGHNFVNRVFYAATRVVWVRSSYSMKNRVNAPLLLGYGSAAGLNNLYYPDQDRGAKNTFQNWGTSLAGAALGFEVDEFLDDALRIVHLRK